MKILIFTEGTLLMFQEGKNLSRQKRVALSQKAGIQREEKTRDYKDKDYHRAETGSVYDFSTYIPIDNAVTKLQKWEKQGATLCYLTSRRIKEEIDTIQRILVTYHFPNATNLVFRHQGEDYKDIAEKITPDILIEDDCESIGGEREMVYPHINRQIKPNITSIVVKEFEGIDHLPDIITQL